MVKRKLLSEAKEWLKDRSPKDLIDLVAAGFCAFMGNEAGAQVTIGNKTVNRIAGAATGILGYRLATVESQGTPPVSQIAGLSLLGSLGLLNVAPRLPDEYATPLSAVSPLVAAARAATGDQFALAAGVSPLFALLKLIGSVEGAPAGQLPSLPAYPGQLPETPEPAEAGQLPAQPSGYTSTGDFSKKTLLESQGYVCEEIEFLGQRVWECRR